MGWETRNGRLYYYRKVRQGNQVISEYVGCGETAELIGLLEAARRDEQEMTSADERDRLARLKAQDQRDEEIFEQVGLLTACALLASGHHQHKGTWRRKRNEGAGTEKAATGR